MIGGRDPRGSKAQLAMARSLPVSVPLPEGLPKRASIFDLPSDEGDEEEESDVDDENNGNYMAMNKLMLFIHPNFIVRPILIVKF